MGKCSETVTMRMHPLVKDIKAKDDGIQRFGQFNERK